MANSTRSAWKNPSYLQSSFGIFMFFCSWGIWWSFFSRWLTDPTHGLGMTSAEQGQIYSINSLATLVIMFAYGAIQDQLGIKRKLVIFISAVAALVGPFVQFVYAPMLTAGGATRYAGVLIGSIVLSAGFMAGCSLFEAVTERYSRKFGFEYGQSRAWAPSATQSWRCAQASCSTSTRCSTSGSAPSAASACCASTPSGFRPSRR